ncbi:hypothetical protein N7481_010401 [Penicillium waksmanii]|uniref:uncharacterized protein n=1 Tax=Penicillium waksmanii TaxID=69791 RepID=UPI0025483A0A|nr:uncharacterized protein N7481_010401 [Penicillium waksmanii]KAJ5973191.1 hypothetical protein N7481_010401 [Penicillium waksmanii]
MEYSVLRTGVVYPHYNSQCRSPGFSRKEHWHWLGECHWRWIGRRASTPAATPEATGMNRRGFDDRMARARSTRAVTSGPGPELEPPCMRLEPDSKSAMDRIDGGL